MLVAKKRRIMYIVLIILIVLVVGVWGYMSLPKFGRAASGERLTRIESSPNYIGGQFVNLEPTPQFTTDKSRVSVMLDYLFAKHDNNRPDKPLPAIKTDLRAIDSGKELFVWFGHSSYLLQSSGKRILVDPVFEDAAPVPFFNKPFLGTNIYSAQQMPDIDYLLITHDHWDHLDHHTLTAIKDRVTKVICPLGVGEHLQYWGYRANQIVEMDWNENVRFDDSITVYCLPARHFSGRTFKSNQTLWAAYMVTTGSKTIYIGGDGGYGSHYAQIAAQFPHIDLAIIENGQYNENWSHIHLMPEDFIKVVDELKPKRVVPVHNGKYALSKHPWYEPLDNVAAIKSVTMPIIGDLVNLNDSVGVVTKWW